MAASSTLSTDTKGKRSRRRPALAVAALAAVLVIGLVGLRVVRSASAAYSVLGELRSLQTVELGDLATSDPIALAAMQGRFARLEADLNTIADQMGPFLPLTQAMGWLPGLGAEVQHTPQLLQLAQGVATAGRASMDGAYVVAHALDSTSDDRGMLARLVLGLEQSQASWLEAEAALRQATDARSQLGQAQLDPRLADQLERLDHYLPLLQTGVSLARLAPALMGAEGPKTYLLLAQNSDELRPTGGFISGAGLLRVDRGVLGEIDFEDSYAVYNPYVDHPLAPPDLEQMMGAQMLLFRDANWSADFPTAASVIRSLYQLDTGTRSDGIIAFDLEAAKRLMVALEPLALPGYPEPLTANNVLVAMREVWANPSSTESTVRESGSSDWWLYRKDFMGDLAATAMAKLESGQVDIGKLAQALYNSLQEKHVLVAVDDQATSALLREAGWNGVVDPGEGDFLLVVDSNVGWNKVNSVVQRETYYTISPHADGTASVQLELVYQHLGEANDEPCVHVARYGDSYDDMVKRCYFNYIRVLVPAGARVVSAEGFERGDITVQRAERGTTQLAGSLIAPPGSTRRVRLSYELPAGLIDGKTYTLRVQKQPGTPSWSVHVLMADPGGLWQPVEPNGVRTEQGVQLSFPLKRDTEVVMSQQP